MKQCYQRHSFLLQSSTTHLASCHWPMEFTKSTAASYKSNQSKIAHHWNTLCIKSQADPNLKTKSHPLSHKYYSTDQSNTSDSGLTTAEITCRLKRKLPLCKCTFICTTLEHTPLGLSNSRNPIQMRKISYDPTIRKPPIDRVGLRTLCTWS